MLNIVLHWLISRAADGIVGVWKLDVERIEIMELDHNPENDKKIQSADVTSLIWHVSKRMFIICSKYQMN